MVACPGGTHVLPVSPTLDDVRCHRPAIYLHVFDRFGRWSLECFLGNLSGFHFGLTVGLLSGSAGFLTCTDGQILFAEYFGLACRPTDINLPFWSLCCPRYSNPGWGDWSRSSCGWGVFCFVLFWLGKLMLVLLLVTRLGLMPCSAWSKKKDRITIIVVSKFSWPNGFVHHTESQ